MNVHALDHELVHVKQYVEGDLSIEKRSKVVYGSELTALRRVMKYYSRVHKVEAYGLVRDILG